jgi:hypothetical protein
MEQDTGQGGPSEPVERAELRRSEGHYWILGAEAARVSCLPLAGRIAVSETRATQFLAKAVASEAAGHAASGRA